MKVVKKEQATPPGFLKELSWAFVLKVILLTGLIWLCFSHPLKPSPEKVSQHVLGSEEEAT